MRTFSILLTADPDFPVPPRFYGGIERIVAMLAEGLAARGHRITLVAHPDSTAAVTRVSYTRRTRSDWSTIAHAAVIARAWWQARPDVIHSFGRLASLGPLLAARVPKVMSYQREISPGSVRWGRRLSRNLAFAACSYHMIQPVKDLADWHVIHNAVDASHYRFAPVVPHDAPLMFLGRIEPIKGPDLAIDLAKRTGRRLIIAGNVTPEFQSYFDEQIKPHVDGRSVQYVGPVDDEAKSRLLSSAAALLMPIRWEEPFGIVMAEALACGTPVIGLARGAVPEVVEHGITGAVCADLDAMTTAIHSIDTFDREACRRSVEVRFSKAMVVERYEALYAQICGAAA
jgi:glycosyltransferase involved in cell wall biosynthesis